MYDDELTEGSGKYSSLYPLVVDGCLKFGDVGGGNGSMNSHTLSQQDWNLKNAYVLCGNGSINIHTLYQYNKSSFFNYMDWDVEIFDVSGVHGSMNIRTFYQHNGFSSLFNSNKSDDIEINGYFEE